MKTKEIHTIIALALISGFLFINAKCNKSPFDCANTKYSFDLPVKAFPNKDTIKVGDTIWLEINEPTSFKDGRTGEMIDYRSAQNLGTALGFQYYDISQTNWLDAVDSFEFKIKTGIELKKTTLAIEYRFEEINNRYLFALMVIPKKKGLYRLVFSNSNNTFRSSNKCTKANFTINFKETNHNRHLVGYTGPDLPGGDLNFYIK
jgi:hypothetical protein